MQQRAAWFRTPNVLVPFGDDFKFQNPHVQYENMDLLIEHVNANVETYGIRMKYATLGQYMDAVRATDTKWPVYTGDFFPYAFAPDGACYTSVHDSPCGSWFLVLSFVPLCSRHGVYFVSSRCTSGRTRVGICKFILGWLLHFTPSAQRMGPLV